MKNIEVLIKDNTMKTGKSIVADKSYDFALNIIQLYKNLTIQQKEFILSKQLLRSGTSIGANINEAIACGTKKDFVYKMNISLKEARETKYWLNLLVDSDYIQKDSFNNIEMKCDELIKILSSIILTTKERYLSQSESKTNFNTKN